MNVIKKIKIAAGDCQGEGINKVRAVKTLLDEIRADFRNVYVALKPFVKDDEYRIRDGYPCLDLCSCKRVVEEICNEQPEYYKILFAASKLTKEQCIEIMSVISTVLD